MATKTVMTADEYFSILDDVRSELVRGEVVEMPPAGSLHGVTCASVTFELMQWARRENVGFVFSNDTAVQTEFDPDTVRGADVMFVPRERLPEGVPEGRLTATPSLCVEVLSPSDRWAEVLVKVGESLRLGVDEVWVVDPREQWVDRHRPDETSRRFSHDDRLAESPALPGLSVAVADLFGKS